MAITTISSRAFNQDTGHAKKAAEKGPVFITDRGTPAHVLLSISEYRRLTGSGKSVVELLAMPDGIDIELNFDPPKMGNLARRAEEIEEELLGIAVETR